MADRIRRRVVVRGRVQGVWFRQSCRDQATALVLSGYVRNLEDGSVEAEFEGPEAAVARAVAWCRTGSPAAVVSTIEVSERPLVDEGRFRIA